MGKDIIKSEETFFFKIKKFFFNLFNKSKTNDIQLDLKEQKNEQKNKFKKDIEITSNEEEQIILNLQKQYKDGNIKEEDMKDEERIKLIELYKKQNEELKKKIEIKKYNIRKKIENLSN